MDELVDGLPPAAIVQTDVPADVIPKPATTTAPAPTVMLQVGSYSSRENAEHALGRLVAAGIASATLSDIASSGKQMWRLRVNAVEAEVDALASRISALGFGLPQRVKE
jgi:rare lipoprotein A